MITFLLLIKMQGMQIQEEVKIETEMSHGLTPPGATMSRLTLGLNSLQSLRKLFLPLTSFTKFATQIPSSLVIDACLI